MGGRIHDRDAEADRAARGRDNEVPAANAKSLEIVFGDRDASPVEFVVLRKDRIRGLPQFSEKFTMEVALDRQILAEVDGIVGRRHGRSLSAAFFATATTFGVLIEIL